MFWTSFADIVTAFLEDADGTMWIGTAGGGINRLRSGRTTSYPTRTGLFDDKVHHILADDRGLLWMSSNRGVFSVPRADLEEYAAGTRTSMTSAVYGTTDGMNGKNEVPNFLQDTLGFGLKDRHEIGKRLAISVETLEQIRGIERRLPLPCRGFRFFALYKVCPQWSAPTSLY